LKEKLSNVSEKWQGATDLFKSIFYQIKESKLLKDYIKTTEHTFAEDRKFLNEIFEIIIADSESFDQYIEERFINWEDDQVLITLALLKSIHSIKENGGNNFIGKFDMKEEEDLDFMKQLFQYTIDHDDEMLKLIAEKTKNWEAERIAVVDMLLMKMALCEILMFPQIPVKVSINEYLELAKIYSTPSSHTFINGVLDKIKIDLSNENKIIKTGRGLVE
jgi:N utilization substance protein B